MHTFCTIFNHRLFLHKDSRFKYIIVKVNQGRALLMRFHITVMLVASDLAKDIHYQVA